MNSDIIEIHDLRKIYKVGKVDVAALRGVYLTVKRGEFLAIVGPSGSGKSTLFHIIGGLTPPTTGEVRVADQDLGALTDAGRTRLRKQEACPRHLTVKHDPTPRPKGASLHWRVPVTVAGSDDACVNSASTKAAKARALVLGIRPVG